MHKWSEDEQEFLKNHIKGRSYIEITTMFNQRFNLNLPVTTIGAAIKRYGLTNDRDSRFQKGQTSFNKGMKGINFGGVETQFKKGNKSHNWVPIGTEKVKADGYLYVKIQDGKLQKNWKQKHKVIWEEVNGPIPKGHYVVFADGNRMNITIDNLILVSQAQMLIMNKNKLIYENPDLTKTGAIIAKVIDKGNKKKKK